MAGISKDDQRDQECTAGRRASRTVTVPGRTARTPRVQMVVRRRRFARHRDDRLACRGAIFRSRDVARFAVLWKSSRWFSLDVPTLLLVIIIPDLWRRARRRRR